MNVIEHAAMMSSPAAMEARLAGRSPQVIAMINQSRRRQGLPELFTRPAPAAASRVSVRWDPTSPHNPARKAAELVRVWIVAAPHQAPIISRYGRPEQFERTAWDLDRLNSPCATWDVRVNHDGKPINAALGGRLRAEIDPYVGLVVSWQPDMANAAARAAVEMIEDGHNAVSVQFRRLKVRQDRNLRGELFDVVERAQLMHVALLPPGTPPAYKRASAWVFRSPPGDIYRGGQRDRAVANARALRG
jgi:hypothetical protein